MDTLRTGDRALIRELNTSIVLDCVRRQGPIARTEIASMTGIGRSTVSGIIGRLLERGLVVTVGAGDSTGGRKPEMLAFNPRRFYSMGIRLAGGVVSGCLSDLDGRILVRATRSQGMKGDSQAVSSVRRVFDQLLEEAGVSDVDLLLGVGVAVSDTVMVEQGVIGRGTEEQGTSGRGAGERSDARPSTLRLALEEALEVSVWIEDTAQVGALGEKWADRGDADDFLFVSVGPRIGASLVVDGRLLGNDRTGVGQLGHMRLLEDGPVCSCGLTGCVESLAGDQALLRYYRENGGEAVDPTVREVAAAAHRGEEAAVRAVDRAGRILGTAVANAVKLIGVNHVVVAGETAVLGGRLYLDAICRQVREELPAGMHERAVVRQSKLGSEVWLAGAAALVIEEVFRPPIYSDANPVAARVVAR